MNICDVDLNYFAIWKWETHKCINYSEQMYSRVENKIWDNLRKKVIHKPSHKWSNCDKAIATKL
jgi:5-methylcytosine-specific restriction endonuclease McrA